MTKKQEVIAEKAVKNGVVGKFIGYEKHTGPVLKSSETPELTPKEEKEVRVIERIIENKEIAPQDAFGKLTRSQINLIKSTIAKGASDDELKMFVQVCKGANLNPFLRQVHLVPRWDSKNAKEVRTIQVSIDGFRSIAESSGAYAGNEDPIFKGEQTIKPNEKGELTVPNGATVTVYKMLGGERCPFTATARWSEYYPGAKLGFQWHIRPYLMLGKCAEALALRKAFPKLLSGMYAQEEMEQSVQVETKQRDQNTAYDKLKIAIGQESTTYKHLEDWRAMLSVSVKYTDDQKQELLKAIDDRMTDLISKQPKK